MPMKLRLFGTKYMMMNFNSTLKKHGFFNINILDKDNFYFSLFLFYRFFFGLYIFVQYFVSAYQGRKKCSFFGKFGVLCFIIIRLALRFALLPYCLGFISISEKLKDPLELIKRRSKVHQKNAPHELALDFN